MRFGIEIETISDISQSECARLIDEHFWEQGKEGRVDIRNHYYHGHNVNQYGFEYDGSLRTDHDHPHQVEIITPPLRLHQLGELKEIFDVLKGHLAINRSCGIHVHVEVPSGQALRQIVRIWYKFENEIIKIFPPSRRNNGYCQRLRSISDCEHLVSCQYGRHSMLNKCCYWQNGTVEFRGHSASLNYRKIKRWVFFCLSLVKKAIEYETRTRALKVALEDCSEGDCLTFLEIEKKTANYLNGRIKHFENGGLESCAA